jgi:hypothetical protein
MFYFYFFLLPALRADAQDAIPVSKEPFHKNVFENEYSVFWMCIFSPGDTTRFHKPKHLLFLFSLHPVRTGSQVIVEDGRCVDIIT